jgi:hypothetical protein
MQMGAGMRIVEPEGERRVFSAIDVDESAAPIDAGPLGRRFVTS